MVVRKPSASPRSKKKTPHSGVFFFCGILSVYEIRYLHLVMAPASSRAPCRDVEDEPEAVMDMLYLWVMFMACVCVPVFLMDAVICLGIRLTERR